METHRNQNAVMGAFVRPKTEEHSGAAVAMERSGATQKRKVSEGMGTEQGTGRTANATRGGKARRTQTVASNGAEAGSSSDTTRARRHEGDDMGAAAGGGREAAAKDRRVAIADTGDGAADGSGTVDDSMRGSTERTRVVGGKRGPCSVVAGPVRARGWVAWDAADASGCCEPGRGAGALMLCYVMLIGRNQGGASF